MRVPFVFYFLFAMFLTVATAEALTFKTNSNGNTKAVGNSALKTLLLDIVTRNREAIDLSDEELCNTLTALDTLPTYNEMKARGLDCLTIDKIQSGWKPQDPDEAVRFLRAYADKYDLAVPQFDLDAVGPVFGSTAQTLAALEYLNPSFRDVISAVDGESLDFCLDWYPKVATIAENQSKNLDGTISWQADSLRDGFVVCQDTFNAAIYMALFDDHVLQLMQNAIEGWISNGTPHRDIEYEGSGYFSYTIHINKILIAIELLHPSFGWNEEQYARARKWSKARVLEFFPGSAKNKWKHLGKKCPTRITKFEQILEVCQNGGILQAQATLRAGIFAGDPELVELSYIAFHRYMSGIRRDGSNIADSRRGCTAADYNIWASQFMTDYLHLWSLIGEPLWEHQSFDQGSPNDAVRYSLSLLGNFEKINEYTVKDSWKGCGEDTKSKTQQASSQPDYYPLVSFAPYFFQSDRQALSELMHPINYGRANRYNYTAQSGTSFEASLLVRHPELQRLIAQSGERVLAERNAKAARILEDTGGLFTFEGGRYRIAGQSYEFRPSKWREPRRPGNGRLLVATLDGILSSLSDQPERTGLLKIDTRRPLGRFMQDFGIYIFKSGTGIGFFNAEDGHPFSLPLVRHQSLLEKKCPVLRREDLIVITETTDEALLEYQVCVASYFRDTDDEDARNVYFTIYRAAQSFEAALRQADKTS